MAAKDDLVELAVGSQQGVKVGETFRVTRGGPKAARVATIRIVCVDEADAIGQIIERGDRTGGTGRRRGTLAGP